MIDIKHKSTLLFISVIIFLIGCNGDSSTPVASSSNESSEIPVEVTSSSNEAYPDSTSDNNVTSSSAYPIDELNTNEGVDVRVNESDVVAELPNPDEGLATVGGVVRDSKTKLARPESIIYLGEVVYTDQDLPVIRLDRQSAPFAILEENGEFIIHNTVPGEYALVYFTPDYSFLLEDESVGESIILTLEPGDVVDIGLIELP